MDGNAVRRAAELVRESDRPRQRTGTTVAAAVHKTPDPSQRMAEGNARRHDVRPFPERQLLPA